MEKNFKRALIVGKFCPLHKGHEFLINKALDTSGELIIFSYTKKQYVGCETPKRDNWLKSLFPTANAFVFDDQNLKDFFPEQIEMHTLPMDEDTDDNQRLFAAKLYISLIGKPLDAIFTSELYGPGFAIKMSEYLIEAKIQAHPVKHVAVDPSRSKVPISGSLVRSHVSISRGFLSPIVYGSFLKKILFLGAESTGKSTLVELCAERYRTVFVDEYGRTHYEQKAGQLEFLDMRLIAEIQLDRERIQTINANRYLFVDTSPLTTLCYSYFLFNQADPLLEKMANQLDYDHIFLCAPDFPMIQDGTRVDESFRDRQNSWYLESLSKRNCRFTHLNGPLNQRVLEIDTILKSL